MTCLAQYKWLIFSFFGAVLTFWLLFIRIIILRLQGTHAFAKFITLQRGSGVSRQKVRRQIKTFPI
jgi:hypothetical protein